MGPLGAEACARDIEFHIGFARTLAHADPTRLAVMGYSWGGLAASIVAARNSNVSGLVCLDATVRYDHALFERVTHRTGSEMRAHLLHLGHAPQHIRRTLVARGQRIDPERERLWNSPYVLCEQLELADAYHAKMLSFEHPSFTSIAQILGTGGGTTPQVPRDLRGYAVMARYVLAFLDGYVGGDDETRGFLRRAPHENTIEDGIIRVDYKLAKPVSA